ncbi:MAG: peptide/nickel transport system substrate-binding protein [Mycobacterium sp.]|nr:peptide/nickel transport system substrate-binding protein [Mycobacterium sp.]
MPRNRRLTAAIAAAAALGLLVSACGGNTAEQSAPHTGGSLVLGGLGDIDFMDPTAGYNTDTHTEERAWTRQLFSYPASADTKVVQSPVADVASELPTEANGGISNNGSTYTIHLRDDVMWNSSPVRAVTADDFVRSFKRMCNPVAPVGAPSYFTKTIKGMAEYCQAESKIDGTAAAISSYINGNEISGVSAPDPKTIVFQLTHPTSDFLDIIAEPFASAVPVEYLQYVPNSPEFRAHLLSDGPYMITTYTPGTQMVLERNPAWKASSDPLRKAYVDKITINQGQTPQAVQQQIQAGTTDMGWDVVVPTPDLPGLTGDPNLSVNSSAAVNYAVFNQQSPNENSAMKNVQVRQALEYAIDKTAIAQALGGTQIANPSSQMLTPIDVGYQPFDLYPTPGSKGDPEKAKQLLAAAGYPNGLTLKVLFPTTSQSPKIAELMQADLQAAGVTVQLVSATQTDFTVRYISDPTSGQRGLWDIALLSWVPDWFGNNGRAVLQPMTDGPNYGPNSVDYGDYNSPITNGLVEQALSLPSSEQAKVSDLWHQVSVQSMKDAAFVPLAIVDVPLYKSSRLTNTLYLPINENFDITNVWLKN